MKEIQKSSEESKEEEDVQVAEVMAGSHENLLSKKKVVIVFCAMAVALFLSFVDQTGITVALPYIAEDLDATDTISWAGTASLISNTMFMVLFGRFSDIFSRKYVLMACLVLLGVFDLACGFAQTAAQLYVFRAMCGIGNGGITSLSLVIVSDVITLQERGKYQGILGAFVGLGNALGPFIASAFISHLSWRKFYYFLGPIVISSTSIVLWLVPMTIPDMPLKEKIHRIDYFGFLTSSIAIVFLLIPVSGGGSTYAWDGGFAISFMIIGGVALMAFLFVEKKIASLPMLPLRLFYMSLSLGSIMGQNFFFGMCYFCHIYYYPYYFQVVRGYSPIHSSVYLLALVVPQMLTSVASGQIISRTGHYIYVIWWGYIWWMVSMGLLLLWSTNSGQAVMVVTLVLNGTGVGAIFQPTLVAAQAESYKRDRAIVVSGRNVLRSFGGAVGLAISSTIISNLYIQTLDSKGGELFSESELVRLKASVFSSVSFAGFDSVQQLFLREALMDAIRCLFYFWMGCMGVCVVTTAFIRDKGLLSVDERGERGESVNKGES